MIQPTQTRMRAARHRCALFVVACVCAFAGTSAHAQIFRCTDADGHATFSDTPCGSTAEKVDVVNASGGLSPISGDGLSTQEHSVLEAAAAADAQRVDQSGGASQPGSSYTSTAASAQRRSY